MRRTVVLRTMPMFGQQQQQIQLRRRFRQRFIASSKYRGKAKGRAPFRDLAPAFRFFEDLVRGPDHTDRHVGVARGIRACARNSLTLPSFHSL